ncbi:hypothetical protein DFH27DRAFT_622511 [Peziza echinospora]|nr:hypothetical protein DFH27DRAFT_622511 [Peziza echinospora]
MNNLRPLLRPHLRLPRLTATTTTTNIPPPRPISLAPPRHPRDEEIPHTHVNFVDEAGVFHGLYPLSELLLQINRETHHLICPNPTSEPPVVAKLVSKQSLLDLAAQHIQKIKLDKLTKKTTRKVVTKEAQISWAISPHDLSYKLKKAVEVLDKGGRIEIHLGGKKGMMKVTLAQVEDLVSRIRAEMETCAKEWKEPEGELGAAMVLFYEGKVGERARYLKKKAENEARLKELLEQRALMEDGAGEFAMSEGHPEVEEELKQSQEEMQEEHARLVRMERERMERERIEREGEGIEQQYHEREGQQQFGEENVQQEQSYPEPSAEPESKLQ